MTGRYGEPRLGADAFVARDLTIVLDDPDELLSDPRCGLGGYRFIVLEVNGVSHRYKPAQLIHKLREIEMEEQA